MALATNALTTLSTIKDRLNISDSSEDSRLENIINAASDMVEGYCKRTFYRDQAIVEKVPAEPSPFLPLSRRPVNSVTSVTYRSMTIQDDTYEIYRDGEEGMLYRFYGDWVMWSRALPDASRTSMFGFERAVHEVTYDGGYWTQKQDDDGAGTRNLPYAVEEATIMLATYLRRSMGRDLSVESEHLGSSAVSYSGSTGPRGGSRGGGFIATQTPAVATMLNPYRNITLR